MKPKKLMQIVALETAVGLASLSLTGCATNNATFAQNNTTKDYDQQQTELVQKKQKPSALKVIGDIVYDSLSIASIFQYWM